MSKRSMQVATVVFLLACSLTTVDARPRSRNRARAISYQQPARPVIRSSVSTGTVTSSPSGIAQASATQSESTSANVVQAAATSVETPAVTNASQTSTPSTDAPALTGWALAADMEARSGGPATHAYSAAQLASIAGYPGASLFVGVGMNGRTCQPGYGRLVAETTVNGKTVRIWLR